MPSNKYGFTKTEVSTNLGSTLDYLISYYLRAHISYVGPISPLWAGPFYHSGLSIIICFFIITYGRTRLGKA